jgi:Ras-related protein Rab-2A
MEEIKSNTVENLVFLLVGNKNDLENRREVYYEEAEKFSKENKMFFIETSAKNFINVDELFIDSAKEILKAQEINEKNVLFFLIRKLCSMNLMKS